MCAAHYDGRASTRVMCLSTFPYVWLRRLNDSSCRHMPRLQQVTGTNGILAPPPGYLAGLKALLSSHGILLVCDEVM